MGVSTSEVGYTPAMPRREDHEVHKGHVVALDQKKNLNSDLCVKSIQRRLQTARVTQSGDAQGGVDFFQCPLSLPQYSRVYVLLLHYYHISSLV